MTLDTLRKWSIALKIRNINLVPHVRVPYIPFSNDLEVQECKSRTLCKKDKLRICREAVFYCTSYTFEHHFLV